MNECICGDTRSRAFTVIERQLGLGDEFTYLECVKCGSLRISSIPVDLAKYYSGSYYSFAINNNWRNNLQPLAIRFAFIFPFPKLPKIHFHFPSIVQAIRIKRSDRVLDVGSGLNGMATFLRKAGHLTTLGVDPFVKEDVRDKHGIVVQKTSLQGVNGQWDLIAFNHSLEHVPNAVAELEMAKALLAPKGRIVVRIPVVSFAFREFGPNWFQIDAPRHLFVPSEKGFEVLANRAALEVKKIVYDSNYLQFWQSENYRRGKAMVQPGSPEYWNLITRAERRRLNHRAEQLNQTHQGDQAIFFLGAK